MKARRKLSDEERAFIRAVRAQAAQDPARGHEVITTADQLLEADAGAAADS